MWNELPIRKGSIFYSFDVCTEENKLWKNTTGKSNRLLKYSCPLYICCEHFSESLSKSQYIEFNIIIIGCNSYVWCCSAYRYISYTHAKPLTKLVVWLNVGFFPCFIPRAHTISFSLSLCFCLWMLKKWNHSIQFNVCCVSTAIPKRFNLNVVVKNFRSIQKRVLATFFFLSRRKCVFSLVSLSSSPVCSFAICPIYYRIIIKNACNKIALFDLFI